MPNLKDKKQMFSFLAAAGFFILFEIVFLYKLIQIFKINHSPWVEFYVVLSTVFLLSRPIINLFYHDHHEHGELDQFEKLPKVSIIIAGKNEEASIYETIESCMTSDYKGAFELIAVNDGSTDKTEQEMLRAKKDFETRKNPVQIISFSENRGKREGMYEGVKVARGEILVFIDSDSFVEKEAISTVVAHFLSDEKIGAVSGNTLVENYEENTLTKMQSARYGISFDVFKSCESVFNCVTCCPGCFSAYRTAAVREVIDAWKDRKVFNIPGTFGDDRSLTNFILKTGWKVIYCRQAVATTIVPDTYKQFIKQQLRWKKSWVREGLFGAAAFMWKKHPIAATSFYINLVIPFVGPIIVVMGLASKLIQGQWIYALIFCLSVSIMSLAYGLYHYSITKRKGFLYSIPFTLFYSVVLVWQMPWAIIRMGDTKWGTR